MLANIDRKISRRNALFIMLAIGLTYLLPFLIADIYYVDDFSRAQTGYTGWGRLGRPLSDLIMQSIGFSGNSLVDTSPLPQILAVTVLCIGIYLCTLRTFKEVSFIKLIIFSIILVNPFFLQNMVYKYDSLPMSIGVFCCCIAYWFRSKNRYMDVFISTSLLVVSLCLYQSSTNIMIGLIALIAITPLFYSSEPKQHSIDFIIKCLAYILSYVLYMAFITPYYGSQTSRGEIIPLDTNGLTLIGETVTKTYELISVLFIGPISHFTLYIAIPISIIGFIYSLVKSLTHNKHTSWSIFSTSLIALSPIIALSGIIGPLFLIKNVDIVPRTLTGSSVTYILILLFSYFGIKELTKKISALSAFNVILIYPIAFSISLSFVFMSSMKSQRAYERVVIASIYHDILSSKELQDAKEITTLGSVTFSPIFLNNVSHYPILYKIGAMLYDWTTYLQLSSLNIKNADFDFVKARSPEFRKTICMNPMEVIADNDTYTITISNGVGVVYLRPNKKPLCN
jgi:hypothetical protein